LRAWAQALKDSPPLRQVRQRRYERLFATARDMQLFRGVYASFAEALRHVPATRPVGYDNPGPSSMYRDMVDRVTPRDYALMFWLTHALGRGARRVFDFGGHVGIKYYAYSRYLGYPADLRWTVCDVPAVAESGRQFAAVMAGSDKLSFTTRFEDAEGCDVFFAAGSLQYVEEPLAARLARLERRPGRLLLSGLPLYTGRSFVTLQSIGTAYCPYNVWNRDEYVAALEATGYALRDEWRNPEKTLHVPFHTGAHVDGYTGMLFEPRA
jgi:putative methyltransferase (TIGR04325 family)